MFLMNIETPFHKPSSPELRFRSQEGNGTFTRKNAGEMLTPAESIGVT